MKTDWYSSAISEKKIENVDQEHLNEDDKKIHKGRLWDLSDEKYADELNFECEIGAKSSQV